LVLGKSFTIDHSKTAYGCPTLVPGNTVINIDPEDIAGPINVQHHCEQAGCLITDTGVLRQEREAAKAQDSIKHADVETFILNMFCFKARQLLESVAPGWPENNTADIDAAINEADILAGPRKSKDGGGVTSPQEFAGPTARQSIFRHS
jgi:hypothetical protein